MARRDYSAKKAHSYKAPRKLVRRDRLRGEIIKRAIRRIAYTLVFIGFLASLIYWFFFSPLFLIQEIEVRGEGGEEHKEALYEVYQLLAGHQWFFVSKSHYALVSEAELALALENSDVYPIIEDAYVEKFLPNKLIITVKERVSRLIVIAVSQDSAQGMEDHASSTDPFLHEEDTLLPHTMRRIGEYLIDSEGVGTEKIDGARLESLQDDMRYPKVFMEAARQTEFRQGETFMAEEVARQITLLHRTFDTYTYLPKIDYFFLDDALSTGDVVLYTKEGYTIYFTWEHSLQKQVNHLLLTLERVGESQQKKLKYIDLRIENRSYVCCDLEDKYVQ